MQQSIEMNWSFRIMFVASVFMGSRLSTIADMFCLLVIELLAFGCRIFTRTLIIKKSKNAYTRIILLQSIFNLCLIGKAQMRLMMYAYVLIEVFIVLLVPYIYLAAYKHKRYWVNISITVGPWIIPEIAEHTHITWNTKYDCIIIYINILTSHARGEYISILC